MATPPSGWSAHEFRPRVPGGGTVKRFNFPSAPSPQVAQPSAPPQHGQETVTPPLPHQQPYGQPPPVYQPAPTGIEPVSAAPSTPSDAEFGAGPVDQQPLVRPYAMTGGRTRPRYHLAIEALVQTTAEPAQLQGQLPEHQRICRLCYEIKSVAEVSALLTIPLGVARILVADLAEAGLVAIHQSGGDDNAGGQPDVTLLERVLSGLRKL